MRDEPAKDQRGLGGLVVRGVAWIAASQGAIQLVSLITSIVVARLLTPSEVGLAAMAIVFVNLALLLADAGLASALVQRQELTEDDKSSAFWASIALGAALTLLGVALSGPIADLYGEPEVQGLFAALSLTFLLTAPGIVQGALLTRELRFRSLEVRTIVATVASSVVAIALAVSGAGPWAIVGQHLAITAVSSALLWRSSTWRPGWRFSWERCRDLAQFGTHVAGTRTFTWLTQNVDNLLVGRFLGAAELGAYSIAYNLMLTPVTRLAGPITHVLYPAFSRLRDPAPIARVWLRGVRLVAVVAAPAMLGMCVVAPEFVAVVFGPQWHESASVLRILAPLGLVRALQAPSYGVLQALGQTRRMVRFTAVASVVSVAAFAAGLPWGIEGVAAALLAVSLVLEPIFLRLTTRAAGISIRTWLASIAGVMQAAVAMLLVVLVVHEGLIRAGLATGLRLLLAIVVGALVYVPLLLWRSPDVTADLRAALAARRRGGEGASVPDEPEPLI